MAENSPTEAELAVLSLICEQPRHGYQIEQQISHRGLRIRTDLATSSIYYLLGKLESKGWIEPAPSSPDLTPERSRKVYQATPAGVSVWKNGCLEALRQPRATQTSFLIGLQNLWAVTPEEALEAVSSYQDWLQNDLQRQLTEYENRGEITFPVDVLFEYGFVLGGAELAFLADLVTRLEERL
jgi:DNA-binding PadR family transcriptional regulator